MDRRDFLKVGAVTVLATAAGSLIPAGLSSVETDRWLRANAIEGPRAIPLHPSLQEFLDRLMEQPPTGDLWLSVEPGVWFKVA